MKFKKKISHNTTTFLKRYYQNTNDFKTIRSFKFQALLARSCKKLLEKQYKWYGQNFALRYFG